MKTVFLATPCYGGLCLEKYMIGIIRLQLLLMRKGIQLMIDTTENESLVHRARNVSVGRFIQKTEADVFLFIDADIDFDPESTLRLIESKHDVSVACYPKKVVMWDQAARALENGDTRPPNLLASSLVVNIGANQRSVQDGFVEVLDGPTGFMAIKRHVFTKLEEAYPELNCVNDHQNADFKTYHAVFDCMIDPDNRRYLSEDYAFCRRWQKIGGSIWADTRTTLGHVGNLPFSACLNDRLKAKPRVKATGVDDETRDAPHQSK